MKNNYRKLKLSILLQTVFITALTVLVGRFILEYFIDGIYNDSFANGFLRILEAFHVSEETATSLYWQWIGNNKVFFMILGFLLLFSLFFYVALSKMTRYLEQVEDGIENIISASDQPIRLITELKPIEDRLNEIKETLRSQEEEAEKLEQRKNDVLLFLAHDLKNTAYFCGGVSEYAGFSSGDAGRGARQIYADISGEGESTGGSFERVF